MSSPMSERNRKPRITRKEGETTPPTRVGHRAGGKLKSGNKGHDGTKAGRKPKAYHQLLQDVLEGAVHQREVRKVLEDSNHPAFGTVYSKVLVHHLGVPKVKDATGEERYLISVDL